MAGIPAGVSAQADATFACDPGFYQVIAGQLASLDPATNSYDTIGQDHSNYNAMGYRNADGYLYGMQGKNLYRIDARGEMTKLSTLDILSGPYTGDFGDDGLLHISRGGGDWYAVNVDTFEATRIPELSVFKSVADVTNVHGKFYGVSSKGELFIYDPVAKTITPGGDVQGLPTTSKAYGAAWSTAGGNLYVGRNSGEIYQITGYSKGSPVATQIGSAPPTNSNDGASCALAPPPPGLNDVDGPEPETQPSTPESQQASDNYNENYAQYEETFAPYDEYQEPEPTPTEPEPVETTDPSSAEPAPVDDAGIGQGAGCEPSDNIDRPERALLGDEMFAKAETPTVLYESGFDGTVISDFMLLSGNWYKDDGFFSQLNTCGFDYTSLLRGHYVNNFRWESTFKAITGDNHGGLVFNQSASDTRSGAMLVDFSDGGERLRWGTYDEAGYYVYQDSIAVNRPATLELVTLAVEVYDTTVHIYLNGERVAETSTINPGGMVGLVASKTDVAFDSVKLTVLPAAVESAPAEPAAEPTTTETTEPAASEPAAEPTTTTEAEPTPAASE